MMAGTTGLEPATSAVTGQRSNQLSYVPQIVFQQLGYISHRIKRFAAFAIFALFYHFAAVDSILGLGGHQNRHRNDRIKSTRTSRIWCPVSPFTEQKFRPLFGSSMQQAPWSATSKSSHSRTAK